MEQGNLRFEGRSLLGLAQLALRQDAPADALAGLERAADRFRRVGARLDTARAVGTHVQLACELGDPAVAEPLAAEARQAFAELGVPRQSAIAEANHALALLLLDRATEAVPLLHAAHEAALGDRGRPVRAATSSRLAWAALLHGSHAAARRWLGETEQALDEAPGLFRTFELAALRVMVTGGQEALAAAQACATDADAEALARAALARELQAGTDDGLPDRARLALSPMPSGSTARLLRLVLIKRLEGTETD